MQSRTPVHALRRPAGGTVEEHRIDPSSQTAFAEKDGALVLVSLDGAGTAVLGRETFLIRPGFIVILRDSKVMITAGPRALRLLVLRWTEGALAALGPVREGLDRTRALYGRASVGLAWRISEELRVSDPLAPWAVDVMASGIAIALTRGARSHHAAPELAKRTRRAIERAGPRDISLAALARELGCSHEHMTRVFRASYGMTPSRFAIWRRVEQAKRILLGGTRPVSDIAIDLGFRDASHLGRHFRAMTGTSPGRFRDVHRT